MLSVQTNLLAQNANRNLKVNTGKNAKITEKLSSGYKINRAADDAAGLSMSEKMRRQVRGLHQSEDNINEGVGYVQTAEGALNEVHDMLQRINELSVKAANGTNTVEDRAYINQEIQQLKVEMNRIFAETTFNEQKIWEPRERRILGYEEQQAVEFVDTYKYMDITNENCGVIASRGYKIHADKDKGVWVTWTGYDGNQYTSKEIDWNELKKSNYRFELSSLFGDVADDPNNALLYKGGDPKNGGVFTQQITFAPKEAATIEDIIKCIDGKVYSVSTSANANARFEDKNGSSLSKDGVTVYDNSTFYNYSSIDMAYRAYYASNHNTSTDSTAQANGTVGVLDFDDADDKFLEPSKANGNAVQGASAVSGGNLTSRPTVTGASDNAKVASAESNQTDKWTFSFYMDGLGTVTATSSDIYYYANDLAADDEQKKLPTGGYETGYWWRWESGYDSHHNYIEKYRKSTIVRRVGDGTLGNVMAALSGEKDFSQPGLLEAADDGGYIEIIFRMNTDKPYEYGLNETTGEKLQDTYVGAFKIKVQVKSSDQKIDVLNRIQTALDDNTILDFYTGSGTTSYGSASIYTPTATTNPINAPIYGGICGFYVQGGTESGQHIGIQYESLSLLALGMADTNSLTQESAERAINEVKAAMQIVSRQRSDFGAYQNRLEHAYNINANVEENTQSSESVIRDTDIAEMVMEHSVNNILLQAGTSMLTQANQSKQSVLELLQ